MCRNMHLYVMNFSFTLKFLQLIFPYQQKRSLRMSKKWLTFYQLAFSFFEAQSRHFLFSFRFRNPRPTSVSSPVSTILELRVTITMERVSWMVTVPQELRVLCILTFQLARRNLSKLSIVIKWQNARKPSNH